MYLKTVCLNLELSILKADLVRMEKGLKPIKNVHRLALLLETRYDLEYESTVYVLYKLQKDGYKQKVKIDQFEELVKRVCEVLDMERDEVVKEIEH